MAATQEKEYDITVFIFLESTTNALVAHKFKHEPNSVMQLAERTNALWVHSQESR